MKFVRRVCMEPKMAGWSGSGGDGDKCPDMWELDDGNFALIGVDITDKAKEVLPESAAVGPNERIIQVPRKLVLTAKPNIPDQ